MRVVVIGAGLGGLAAAAHLVRRGHEVTVLEREPVPGGRAGVFAEAGFRIDTGPTMITMPELLTGTFAAAGADIDRYVDDRAARPDVPSDVRRRFGAARAPRPRGHGRRDPRTSPALATRPRSASSATGSTRSTRSSSPPFVDSQLRQRVPGRPALAAGLADAPQGRLQAASTRSSPSFFEDERLQRVFSFHSLQAGRGAARRAGDARGAHVHGEHRRRVHRARRHARRRDRAWRGRSPTPVPRSGTTRR